MFKICLKIPPNECDTEGRGFRKQQNSVVAGIGLSIVVLGHESDKLLLLTTPSEAMHCNAQCAAFSGRKLAESGQSNGLWFCGSSQGFAPGKPKEKPSCTDLIHMTGIRECLRLCTCIIVQALLQVLKRVGCFQFPAVSGMKLLFPDFIRIGLTLG